MKLTPEELAEVNGLQHELNAAQQALREAQDNFLRAQGAAQYVGKKLACSYGIKGEFEISLDGTIITEKAVATGE